MWNSLDLECPSSDVVAYPPQDHYIMEGLRDFVTVLMAAANTLTSESPLWNDMKVLHNIQVKYKRILRCDRLLIFLQRVGHCLRKMVLISLSKSYLDLAERFLVGFQDPSGTPFLPSRQQVEYVLIRTLSASRLVSEAITYSRDSFCYLIQKIKVGHLILDLIMATSIIARLNILLRATLEQLCSMYKKVLYWRYKIKRGEFQWAQKFDFPQDVEKWIKSFDPAHLKPVSLSKEDIDRVKSMLHQTSGVNHKSEMSDSESVILIDETKVDSSAANDIIMIEADCGEVIPRTEVQTNRESVKKKKVKSNPKLIKEKKNGPGHNLTTLQKSLLQKITKIQSLKDLENLWCKIKCLPQDNFPRKLTKKKETAIDKLFLQIKSKKFNKSMKMRPNFIKLLFLFSERLGFSKDHIDLMYKVTSKNDLSEKVKISSVPGSLIPVKTVKKLKLLYKQLKEILELNQESEKLQLLTTIFKHRMIDIRHLKGKGEKQLARKLISCTSKEFLALYQ